MPPKVNTTVGFLLMTLLLCVPVAAGAQSPPPLTPEQYTQDFDYLWSHLRDGYAYFDKKQTDWNRVRDVYRPQAANVKTKRAFVTFLEHVLDELYDPHTCLNTNTSQSTRLIPTGLDVWAEWQHGKAIITQLRHGFSAEQAGLKVGMEIVSINAVPVETAVRNRLGVSLKRTDQPARDWALRALLAGTHDTPRVIEAKDTNGTRAVFRLDLPTQTTADNDQAAQNVEAKLLQDGIGYIKINNLGDDATVADFDAALEQCKTTRGLILDLRATQSGGSTSVAEPILGRFITRTLPYQKGKPRHGSDWTRTVAPRGPWTYQAPLVVLVGRWTASMGEGMAIGLDGMKRATVVGTGMAGLNGSVFDLQLPNTKISLRYAGEKLFHVNGTPREAWLPPVVVDLRGKNTADPVLGEGIKTLDTLLETKH